jgi:hypothetical protein
MTQDEAFKILAAENLAGFGWTVTAADIPDFESVNLVFGRLIQWWNGLTGDSLDIIRELDLADGLWSKGWLTEFPAMYNLLSGNRFGTFAITLEDVQLSLRNARDRAPDYAAQHVGTLQDELTNQEEAQQ